MTLAVACVGRDQQQHPTSPRTEIEQFPSPSPFTRIEAGGVEAIVPDGWLTRPADPTSGVRQGFIAAPRPHRWQAADGRSVGMVAAWVDATRIGLPSDFYYLAARGPLLSGLTGSSHCTAQSHRVFADHLPRFAQGEAASTGDYVARGEGTCSLRGRDTRWAYFVAAPGFGPARHVGIARSGLYVVVAVMRASPDARSLLDRMLEHTRFGDAAIDDFVAAVQAPAAVA
jgi:hypothetical protein